MNLIKEKIDVTKKQIGIVIIGLACLSIFSSTAFADGFVRGYHSSSGSYVQVHPRFFDGYSDDDWRNGLNDDSYIGDNRRKPRSKWEKWGTVW